MAFQLKDFRSIAASMINWVKATTDKVTDFNTGSVARTLIEASAAELDQLYINIFTGLREAIPVSVFQSFGFEALPARAASGTLRFTTPGSVLAAAQVVVPAGTRVRMPATGQVYATLARAVIRVGDSYVDVLCAAEVAGSEGNGDAGSITDLVSSVPGVGTVANPLPLINGSDAEDDTARRIRFQSYIASLARGTGAAVIYGAKTASISNEFGVITEYVAHASVEEPWRTDDEQPVSLVNVYIHNGASATSNELVARAQQVIDGYYDVTGTAVAGWKAAGVRVVVYPAVDVPVDVTGTVYVAIGADANTVVDAALDAVRTYIQSRGVGAPVLYAELVAIVQRDVEGVDNIVYSAPLADTEVDSNEKAIPGTITITAAP